MRYEITTFDVCASGMERLRNKDEFILVAHIEPTSTPVDLEDQWLADIQACERSDDFDYGAADALVRAHVAERLRPLWDLSKDGNPFALDSVEDIGMQEDADSACVALLYIRDNGTAERHLKAVIAAYREPHYGDKDTQLDNVHTAVEAAEIWLKAQES